MRFSFFQIDAARARKGGAVAHTRDFFLRFTSLLLAEKEVRLQSVHKDRHFDQSSCHLFDKVSSLRYFCKVAMTVVSNERTSLLFAALPSCEDAVTIIQKVRRVAFDLMVAVRLPQLVKGPGFDLTYPLASDRESTPDFLQCLGVSVVKTKSHANDSLLTGGKSTNEP